MKYVILGSLGNISKPLSEKLIAARHSVTIVSSNENKAEDIIMMGAKAAIGSVNDVEFLTRTFIGADAVYTLVPPYLNASDWKKYIAGVGENYAAAIKSSKVRNVVNLSSIGAHMPEGCGPVSGLHYVEAALDRLEGVNVRHLRPGFFYTNLLSNVGMARNMGIIGGNYGDHAKMIFVHTDDIAEVAFNELNNLSFKGKSIRYIASDEKTTDEIASVLGKAIGNTKLSWVNFSDADTKDALIKLGLSEEVARNYAEMGSAIRSGEMQSDYLKHRPETFGKTKLEAFASTFASVYSITPVTTKSNVGN